MKFSRKSMKTLKGDRKKTAVVKKNKSNFFKIKKGEGKIEELAQGL